MCLPMYVGVCIHAGTCMWGLKLDVGCLFLEQSPPCFLRQALSVNLELRGSTRQAEQWAPEVLLPPSSQERGYSYMSSYLAFYMSHGEPNSGPHIYLASTSPTEPSPSFQYFSKECISGSVIKTFVGPSWSDILLSVEYSSLHLITYKAFLQGINLLHKIFLIIIKQILTFNLASHISLK